MSKAKPLKTKEIKPRLKEIYGRKAPDYAFAQQLNKEEAADKRTP